MFQEFIALVSIFWICVTVRLSDARCGGFLENTRSDRIESPNYPNTYPNEAHCIWFIQAPMNYSLVLNISSGFRGESNCDDYLRVTNGNADFPDLYYGCDDSTPTVVNSNTRWLWVQFYADNRINNTGFEAEISTIADPASANSLAGDVNYTSPHKDCQSVHFSCPNKECISAAYRCDMQYDCGCNGDDGCDEDNCGGLALSMDARIAIGVTFGALTFTSIFVGIGAVEIWMKKRSEQAYQQKVKDARIRARKKKHDQQQELQRQGSTSRPSTATNLTASRKNSSVSNIPALGESKA